MYFFFLHKCVKKIEVFCGEFLGSTFVDATFLILYLKFLLKIPENCFQKSHHISLKTIKKINKISKRTGDYLKNYFHRVELWMIVEKVTKNKISIE